MQIKCIGTIILKTKSADIDHLVGLILIIIAYQSVKN